MNSVSAAAAVLYFVLVRRLAEDLIIGLGLVLEDNLASLMSRLSQNIKIYRLYIKIHLPLTLLVRGGADSAPPYEILL